MSSPTTYLLVKTETARKTGRHAEGSLTYVVLRDTEEVYLALTANDGGGHFGREAVPFSAVERCVEGLADQPIPAKAFKSAFVSRSANNPGFLVAVLRSEGLLVEAPEATHQHRLGTDWAAWRKAMLAAPGEPYDLPGATPAEAPQAAAGITPAEEPAGPDTGKGRKPRKAPKGERQRPSGKEADHASHP
jgi:hypothetical protein